MSTHVDCKQAPGVDYIKGDRNRGKDLNLKLQAEEILERRRIASSLCVFHHRPELHVILFHATSKDQHLPAPSPVLFAEVCMATT